VPTRVYPVPTVKAEVANAVSAFPMIIELVLGVKDVTAGVVEPAEELPVDVDGAAVVTALSSYIETEPVAVEPKDAAIVFAPVLAAVVYHM